MKFEGSGAAREETGATAVEYALLAAAIAAVIVVIVVTIGTDVLGYFTDMSTTYP